MEYVYEYLVFLAQVATLVIALLVVVSVIAGLNARQQGAGGGSLRILKINDTVREMRHAMEAALLPSDTVKKRHKAEAQAQQKESKAEAKAFAKSTKDETTETPSTRGRVFAIRFEGDLKASAVDHLRREVSAVLTMATPDDEVVVSIESPGGMVHAYGLAASQLTRFRDRGIPLTAVVDKVAASGGYLMAVVANRIVAAPFALLGSIGVVAQVPNVHRLLKKNDVDVEVLTAGKYKRTLTLLGENTEEGRTKFQEELEDVHALFQEFVKDFRPDLDIETVATGEAWYGKRALELKLVDELATSDEVLISACEDRDVYQVRWEEHVKPLDRIMERFNGTLGQVEDLLSGLRRGV